MNWKMKLMCPSAISRLSRTSFSVVLSRLYHSEQSHDDSARHLELSKISSSSKWNCMLQECLDSELPSLSNDQSFIPVEYALKRLRSLANGNQHIINAFRSLSNSKDVKIQWLGIVPFMFSKAVDDVLQTRNDFIEEKQKILFNLLDHLHRKMIFEEELSRIQLFCNDHIDLRVLQIVNSFFTSRTLYEFRKLKDPQISWIVGSIIELMCKSSLKRLNYSTYSTLSDWEQRALQQDGILLCNGCRASIELSKHEPKFHELGFQFGKHVTLAKKASAEIQQFLNYRNSKCSTFSLNLLPVVMYLEKNPETVASIVLNKHPIDNLDLYEISLKMEENKSVEASKRQLDEYVQMALVIVKEFKDSKAAQKLIDLIEVLNQFQE